MAFGNSDRKHRITYLGETPTSAAWNLVLPGCLSDLLLETRKAVFRLCCRANLGSLQIQKWRGGGGSTQTYRPKGTREAKLTNYHQSVAFHRSFLSWVVQSTFPSKHPQKGREKLSKKTMHLGGFSCLVPLVRCLSAWGSYLVTKQSPQVVYIGGFI